MEFDDMCKMPSEGNNGIVGVRIGVLYILKQR